jgi:hypothetical protein
MKLCCEGETVLDIRTEASTAWSEVVLEKLIVAQLIKKFRVFYGTRRFITVFIIARYPESH